MKLYSAEMCCVLSFSVIPYPLPKKNVVGPQLANHHGWGETLKRRQEKGQNSTWRQTVHRQNCVGVSCGEGESVVCVEEDECGRKKCGGGWRWFHNQRVCHGKLQGAPDSSVALSGVERCGVAFVFGDVLY